MQDLLLVFHAVPLPSHSNCCLRLLSLRACMLTPECILAGMLLCIEECCFFSPVTSVFNA